MHRLLVIVNPAAGNCRVRDIVREAHKQMLGWEILVRQPRSRGELQDLFHSREAETCSALALIGGDGTVNAVLSHLIHRSHLPLAVFASGTANDLARDLRLPSTWTGLQALMDRRETRALDVIRVNGSHHFVTVGGIGVGAIVTRSVNLFRSRSPLLTRIWGMGGSNAYGLFAAQTIAAGNGIRNQVRVETASVTYEGESASVLVCNQATFGGNITVADQARNDDGRLEVAVLGRTRRGQVLAALGRAKLGPGLPADSTASGPWCRITSLSGGKIPFFGDGEFLLEAAAFDIEVLPGALHVFAPSPEGHEHPGRDRKAGQGV